MLRPTDARLHLPTIIDNNTYLSQTFNIQPDFLAQPV